MTKTERTIIEITCNVCGRLLVAEYAAEKDSIDFVEDVLCEYLYAQVIVGRSNAIERVRSTGATGREVHVCQPCCLFIIENSSRHEVCPHGEPPHECNACMVAGDYAADAAREDRVFGR
jgi:hypothetical protein